MSARRIVGYRMTATLEISWRLVAVIAALAFLVMFAPGCVVSEEAQRESREECIALCTRTGDVAVYAPKFSEGHGRCRCFVVTPQNWRENLP